MPSRSLPRFPNCVAARPQTVADSCDLVFITTPDDAINAVARAVTWQRGQGVVHCSGALPASVLSVVEQHGALPGAFPPTADAPGRASGVFKSARHIRGN